ncbi:hypothetical protein HJC23_001272 [Cyclotella cryptica]|uniref:Disease resistance R13L4/SHOC-2-like LRR domain-containing protein n=1 Tax=Cyclotella cryptica TaxID=29204 RepID=A0ABD3PFY3_9STRA
MCETGSNLCDTGPNSKAKGNCTSCADAVTHKDETLGPACQDILDWFQSRQNTRNILHGQSAFKQSSHTKHVIDSRRVAQHGEILTGTFCKNCVPEEIVDEALTSVLKTCRGNGKRSNIEPFLDSNSHDNYALISLLQNSQENMTETTLEVINDNPPVPVCGIIQFTKDKGAGYSSKQERPSPIHLAVDDIAPPQPIVQLIGARKSYKIKDTGINAHASVNSCITVMLDEGAADRVSQSAFIKASVPMNDRTDETMGSLPCESPISETTTHHQDNSRDSGIQENNLSNTGHHLPIRTGTTDIIIPEAFLVTDDQCPLDAPSSEDTGISIPTAQVLQPEKYLLNVAGRKVNFGILALLIFILISIIVGLTLGVLLNNTGSSTTPDNKDSSMLFDKKDPMTPIESNVGNQNTEEAIRHDIEENVLSRNTLFSDLLYSDYRNTALGWILHDDKMQLNVSSSNLHQRYVVALLGLHFQDALQNWLSVKEHECEWYGVSCLGGIIRILDLEGFNLTGTLPPEINRLNFLQNMKLNDNFLDGTLPPEIRNMRALKSVDISSNQFTGGLSSSLGNLTELTYLDISDNQFTGSLTSWIGNLTELISVNTSCNDFTGSLPTSIGNLTKLTSLVIFSNWFLGSLPTGIGILTELTYLDISYNQLTGIFPTSIGNLTQLTYLDISGNEFTGSLPTWIGNLTKLTYLDISYNQFTGFLPTWIGNLTNLNDHDIWYNQFTQAVFQLR